MNSKPTLEQVALKTREIAQSRPEHVYREETEGACRYFEDRRGEDGEPVPGCLLGHAFMALGISPRDVPEGMEASKVLAELGIISEELADWGNRDPSVESDQNQRYDLVQALDSVQSLQDGEEPWGTAVRPLEDHFNAYGEPA